MAKARTLRRLVPDEALLERRAAGESLRALAPDYGVAHSTLLRYLRRPEVRFELREARRRLPAQRRAAKAERAKERRIEQDVRKRAREEAERDRELEAWRPPERRRRSAHEVWLDDHEAPRVLHSRDLYSTNDRKAEKAVAAGGGVEQVVEATGLRGRENVYRLDAQIMLRAL